MQKNSRQKKRVCPTSAATPRRCEALKAPSGPSARPRFNKVESRSTKKINNYFLWPRGRRGLTQEETSSGARSKKKYINLYLGQVISFLKSAKNTITELIKDLPPKFVKVALILIVSFLSVVIFINREKFSPDYVGIYLGDLFAQGQRGGGYPYKISGNKVSNENFKTIDKSLFLLSDTTLTTLNTSASEMQKEQHSFPNPMLRVSGTCAIIYDLGGKHLKIKSKSKTIHTAEMENNIISAAISNYGTFGVVTEFNNFLGQLTIFAKNGKDVYYKYNFADHYITDMAISENGKSAAVCGSTAKNGSMVSSVYVFDYKSETPKVKLDYEDNMFIRVEYLSNGNVVAVGDHLVTVINPRTGEKHDYNYENKTLIHFDVNKNGGILLALSLSEDGNNTDMVVINKSGKVDNVIHTEHNVKAVNFSHRKLAALSYGKVYVYNFSGNHLKTVDVGNDAKNIRLYSGRDMYVLGVTEVRKIRI